MNANALRQLLDDIRAGRMEVDQAMERLRRWPTEDLGFARIDHQRDLRCGFPEVIYCEGKTTEQVVQIFGRHAAAHANILATRAAPEVYDALHAEFGATIRYNAAARCVVARETPQSESRRTIAVVTAGTADIPVAEEALETARIMDQSVDRLYDVGVAGIHRLLAHTAALQSASVVVVVAGMEGALASVVGGLVERPVVAVPTSVGYGASFGGLAALLTMLNSCASNVMVVNIDNRFGAGYTAALINRLACEPAKPEDAP